MKKLFSMALIIIFICSMLSSCQSMDNFIELSHTVCINQAFESPELAIEGMENEAKENKALSLGSSCFVGLDNVERPRRTKAYNHNNF